MALVVSMQVCLLSIFVWIHLVHWLEKSLWELHNLQVQVGVSMRESAFLHLYVYSVGGKFKD